MFPSHDHLARELEKLGERQILGADKAAELAHVKQLYKESLSVRKALDTPTGNVKQNRLVTALKSKDEHGFSQTNTNPLYEGAKAYNSIIGTTPKDFPAPTNMLSQILEAAVLVPTAKGYANKGIAVRNAYNRMINPDQMPLEEALGYLGSVAGRKEMLEDKE